MKTRIKHITALTVAMVLVFPLFFSNCKVYRAEQGDELHRINFKLKLYRNNEFRLEVRHYEDGLKVYDGSFIDLPSKVVLNDPGVRKDWPGLDTLEMKTVPNFDYVSFRTALFPRLHLISDIKKSELKEDLSEENP